MIIPSIKDFHAKRVFKGGKKKLMEQKYKF
jgi:hypothetical protein